MINVSDLLSGTKVLEEITSKINGEIRVVRDLTWGIYIKVGGLTQSGGILTDVWKKTLEKVKSEKQVVGNCLILGLGGGSVANLVNKNWPQARIIGVDIDPLMVEMGKKYLGLEKSEVEVNIIDAEEFVQKEKSDFDLILIDLYCGDKFPEKFTENKFIEEVKNVLNKNGIAVFNRLYGPDDRRDSLEFAKKLEKNFVKVEYFYPQANVEFICYVRS